MSYQLIVTIECVLGVNEPIRPSELKLLSEGIEKLSPHVEMKDFDSRKVTSIKVKRKS